LKQLLLLLQLGQTLSDTQAKHEEEFTKRAEHALLTDMRAANQQKPYDKQHAALDKFQQQKTQTKNNNNSTTADKRH
jgi:hypothetical protein